MNQLLIRQKIGFIGAGKMAQAMIEALVEKVGLKKRNIFITNKNSMRKQKICDRWGVVGLENNEELVQSCDIVVLAMKPQDLQEAVGSISSAFEEPQILVSLLAGIDLKLLKRTLPNVQRLVRVMPNTPMLLGRGVISFCALPKSDPWLDQCIEELFSPSGSVFKVSEGESFESLAVAASCGVGFVYELMIYWQEWLEDYGFKNEMSKDVVLKTFLGAALLAEKEGSLSFKSLQERVASKKGLTESGLQSMRELEIERALRYSFEKAILRGKEILQEEDL